MRNSEIEGIPRGWQRGEASSDDVEGVPESMRKSPVPEYEPEDAKPASKKKKGAGDALKAARQAGSAVASGIRKAGQFARETAPKVGKAIQTTRETAAKYAPAHPSGHPSASSPFASSQGGMRGQSPMGGFGMMGAPPGGPGIFGGIGSIQPPAPAPKKKKGKKKAQPELPRDHGIFGGFPQGTSRPGGHGIFGGMQMTARPEQFIGPVKSRAKKPKW